MESPFENRVGVDSPFNLRVTFIVHVYSYKSHPLDTAHLEWARDSLVKIAKCFDVAHLNWYDTWNWALFCTTLPAHFLSWLYNSSLALCFAGYTRRHMLLEIAFFLKSSLCFLSRLHFCWRMLWSLENDYFRRCLPND